MTELLEVRGEGAGEEVAVAPCPIMELNNNHAPSSENSDLKRLLCKVLVRQDSVSGMSVSSVSSSNSDTSEGTAEKDEDQRQSTLGQSVQSSSEILKKEFRTMSEGQAGQVETQDVFPSLPDSVLEKLGLLGNGTRNPLTAEEIEQKFIALVLAFAIDSTTIKDRCERQKRYRDQTEKNLITEMGRLSEKIANIRPLCTDVSTADLLTGLLAQMDIILRAFSHALISTERYGAVQHEQKLTEAVGLMINHVTFLKKQRDAAKKQVQYTKEVLQVTTNTPDPIIKTKHSLKDNKPGMGRRASIAAVSQSQENQRTGKIIPADGRKITRRTSDISSRGHSIISTYTRSSRLSRFDLNVDLAKIKEDIAIESKKWARPKDIIESADQSEEESEIKKTVEKVDFETAKKNISTPANTSEFTFRQKLDFKFNRIATQVQKNYERCSEDGSLHDLLYFASLLCFSFAIIILANLFIEFEMSKAFVKAEKKSSSNYFFDLMIFKNG